MAGKMAALHQAGLGGAADRPTAPPAPYRPQPARLRGVAWRLRPARVAMALVALALVAVAPAPAAADDARTCHSASGDAAIVACDRAIASGRHSGTDLARLHTSRGVERKRKQDLDGAIADYGEAIRLNPSDQFAWNNRANARRDKGDLDGAIADYGEALRVDPDYTAAYVNRGLLHERMGNLPRARADFEEAVRRPAKYRNGAGGQRIARERLERLGKG